MKAATRNGPTSARPRSQQQAWRARVPALQHIVEDLAPKMFEAASSRRDNLPSAWMDIVASMQLDVHAEADEAMREQGAPADPLTIEELRGYRWSFKIRHVMAMVEELLETIRGDLGFEEGQETLATMALVRKALLHLNVELQDGGSKDGREDREENRYRVLGALRALTPRFDDVRLQRVRAIEAVERCVRYARLPSEADVEQSLQDLTEYPDIDPQKHREFMLHDQPVMGALLARQSLAEIDNDFAKLDPLLIIEELADASGGATGGKNDDGEGRTGPVRALARLAVTAGALGFAQREAESFDAAVERARGSLLTTRSRFRKVAGEVSDSMDSTESRSASLVPD